MIVSRAQSLQIVRVAGTVGVAILFASCAATQKTVGGWIGSATPTPGPKAPTGAQAPRAYYARVEGLKVYSEPSSASKVVGTLSLREKVTRSKVERGYALVESTKSGVKGWVDNAQLTWRLPAAPSAAAPAVETPPVAPTGQEQAEPEEPVAPPGEEPQEPSAPEATATEPMPTPTSVPTAPPSSLPTPRAVGPSIFNPY